MVPGTGSSVHFSVQLDSKCFSYFWEGSTELVSREVLRLSRLQGGWGLPCISIFSELLSLRHIFDVLDDVGCPARPLVLYFLGPCRRELVPRGLGNNSPSCEVPPLFYAEVVRIHKCFVRECPQLNVRQLPVSRISELLLASRRNELPQVQNIPLTWLQLTSRQFPDDVQDFLWRAAHGVLPTLDRLSRWGITRRSGCPNCGAAETNRHAVDDCVNVKSFLTLVSRTLTCRVQVHRRSRFETLVWAIALFVAWKGRCIAVTQHRPYRMMYPKLIRLRKVLCNYLEQELFELGLNEFLKKWSTRFFSIGRDSTVQLPFRMP